MSRMSVVMVVVLLLGAVSLASASDLLVEGSLIWVNGHSAWTMDYRHLGEYQDGTLQYNWGGPFSIGYLLSKENGGRAEHHLGGGVSVKGEVAGKEATLAVGHYAGLTSGSGGITKGDAYLNLYESGRLSAGLAATGNRDWRRPGGDGTYFGAGTYFDYKVSENASVYAAPMARDGGGLMWRAGLNYQFIW